TRKSDEEPMVMGVRFETPCTRITAISLVGSAPTTVNVAVRPSENVTVVFGGGPPCGPPGGPPGAPGAPLGAPPGFAPARDPWVFGQDKPAARKENAGPSSDWRPRSVSNMTTLGTTLAAT